MARSFSRRSSSQTKGVLRHQPHRHSPSRGRTRPCHGLYSPSSTVRFAKWLSSSKNPCRARGLALHFELGDCPSNRFLVGSSQHLVRRMTLMTQYIEHQSQFLHFSDRLLDNNNRSLCCRTGSVEGLRARSYASEADGPCFGPGVSGS